MTLNDSMNRNINSDIA